MKILNYGGHGVDIKIHSMHDTEAIHWNRGNSFCLVECKTSNLKTPDGTLVRVTSINGIGQIRWDVQNWEVESIFRKKAEGTLSGTGTGDSSMHLEVIEHFKLQMI